MLSRGGIKRTSQRWSMSCNIGHGRTDVKSSSQREKTLHHPYQKLISWKSNGMLHLFSLAEAVTLNSFLRRASIYFASTCLLKPLSGDDDNITAILSMSPSHSVPHHYEGIRQLMLCGPAGSWTFSLTSTDARPNQTSYSEHRKKVSPSACAAAAIYTSASAVLTVSVRSAGTGSSDQAPPPPSGSPVWWKMDWAEPFHFPITPEQGLGAH